MDIVIICPIVIMLGIIAAFIITKRQEGKKIKLNDINAHDLMQIKGEYFIVVSYSSNGLIRLKKKSNEKEYLIQFDKDVELRRTNVFGSPVIKVYNFKGTVGGDYLNLIKK